MSQYTIIGTLSPGERPREAVRRLETSLRRALNLHDAPVHVLLYDTDSLTPLRDVTITPAQTKGAPA